MAATPRCSECKAPLVNEDGTPKPRGTRTCNKSCRQIRARRLKREAKKQRRRAGSYEPHEKAVAEVIAGETEDVAREVVREELVPIVREQLTADVLRSISGLVQEHMPRAIEVLAAQMDSDDETIAQRAATLISKYTLGNPSVAPAPADLAPAPMSVVFNIPRPGDVTGPEVPAIGDAEALRTCTDCGEAKTEGEFVGASPRCQACFDTLHATLQERFAEPDETAP